MLFQILTLAIILIIKTPEKRVSAQLLNWITVYPFQQTPVKATDPNTNELLVENKSGSIFSENDIELTSEYPVLIFLINF